jgi:hypothetical protein
MKQTDVRRLLRSLPTPPLPNGLEERVLAAVHARQQSRLLQRKRLLYFGTSSATVLTTASALFFAYQFAHSSSPALLSTFLANVDAVPAQEGFFALLESAPLGSLAAVLAFASVACVLRAVRAGMPGRSLNFSHPLHI